MTTILDGKKLSKKILDDLKGEIKKINKKIKLGIVVVGNDPASHTYIEQKKKIGKELGIEVKIYPYPSDITTKKLRKEIGRICRLPSIYGVIVQLPLPKNLNVQAVLNSILPNKDVDVLSRESVGRLYLNSAGTVPTQQDRVLLPPTVAGIIKLLEEYKIDPKEKTVAIVGFGRLVGKPTSLALAQQNATVIIVNEFTKNKKDLLKKADIIISGTGKPEIITKDMIKKGAVVIDAGFNVVKDKNGKIKIKGDVSYEAAKAASYIAPVPGGVGPMTVAMLFYNLIALAKK